MSTIHYNVTALSAAVLSLERSPTKEVAELFWIIWNDEEHWRYTNWHETLHFDDANWEPAVISRGEVERGLAFASNTMQLRSVVDLSPFDRFLDYDVPVPVKIRVLRYFPNSRLDEAWAVYNGYVVTPEINAHDIVCACTDKTHVLERDVIRMLFQPCCNWRVGDLLCGVDLSVYTALNQTVADIDKTLLTFNDLNGPDGNPASLEYYLNGWMTFNQRRYTIVDHAQAGAGGTITLLFVPDGLVIGASVDLTAGCDLKIGTCYEKFNNLDRFSGFPFIPTVNPGKEISMESITDEDVSPTQDLNVGADTSGNLIKL